MSSISVQFIGSGDAFASGGKFNTCFHIKEQQSEILIDCGASSLIGIKKSGINPNNISHIFISHFHGDHFGGLPFFILDAQLVQARSQSLKIIGPLGVEERVQTLMEAMFKGSTANKFSFEIIFIEIEDEIITKVDDKSVTYFPVIHSPESNPHGLRIELGGKTIAYSGDTEWTNSLISLADGADLFIVECYNRKGLMKFHMNYDDLITNRSQLNCPQVMLTHLGDDMLKFSRDAAFEVCEDGMIVVL
ncbi:MAG: MBL fold metallo-hydrolase [Bacteroidetes bacterium]|nr:MBL fold metallo-hydrolase [Bacteroidota bacterium]